ncbi:hypothetical protein GGX14DRAFT_701914 [Mycena pura]|uniref:Uncharacterized protein n=1 Tax=Mycena pura TaxID=153505 RepID=A0AAD6UTF7_9AGAR|nr:hypothetical protein GGX14DRAFT_701914 [Mycena pura]
MAQRRTQAQNVKLRRTDPTDDFDFLASQQSTGSDDQALQVAVTQQLMASKEKKRKEMEKKFFQAAKARLSSEMSDVAESVRSTVEAAETLYSKFILEYAAIEDTIRALWVEVKREEQVLVDIAAKIRASNDTARLATERAQIDGMAQVKEACYETRSIIQTLQPESI